MKTFRHFIEIPGDGYGDAKCIPSFVPGKDVERHNERLSAEFAPLDEELRGLATTALLGEQAQPVHDACRFVTLAIVELSVLGAMEEWLARCESRLSINVRQQIHTRDLVALVEATAKLREVRDAAEFVANLTAELRAEIADALVQSRKHVAEHAGVVAAAERFGSKLRKLVAKEETAAAQ